MLKFKKTSNSPTVSPCSSPVASLRRPKLVTRIDSIGGPVEHQRVSLFEDNENQCEEKSRESNSSSGEDFDVPESKLRDVTKRKLNREKKKQIKQELKKELNVLSGKDFFNRQQELKIWIHETTGKNVTEMAEKKLKQHYKKFVEKWNKKKLHMKYYRGVDLHSSPLPTPDRRTSERPKSIISDNSASISSPQSLWIAPPIPMIDTSPDDVSTPTKQTTCSTFGQHERFATIGKASPISSVPAQAHSILTSISDKPIRTPPKPPVRRRVTSVITTLPTGSNESLNSSLSGNSYGGTAMRAPQPRMGSVMSSMRKSRPQSTTFSSSSGKSSMSSEDGSSFETLPVKRDEPHTSSSSESHSSSLSKSRDEAEAGRLKTCDDNLRSDDQTDMPTQKSTTAGGQEGDLNSLNNAREILSDPCEFNLTVKNNLNVDSNSSEVELEAPFELTVSPNTAQELSSEGRGKTTLDPILQSDDVVSVSAEGENDKTPEHSLISTMKMDPVGSIRTPPPSASKSAVTAVLPRGQSYDMTITSASHNITAEIAGQSTQASNNSHPDADVEENYLMSADVKQTEQQAEGRDSNITNKRRSGEKRSLSVMESSSLPASIDNNTTLSSPEPSNKKRTVWNEEIEKSSEVFV